MHRLQDPQHRDQALDEPDPCPLAFSDRLRRCCRLRRHDLHPVRPCARQRRLLWSPAPDRRPSCFGYLL